MRRPQDRRRLSPERARALARTVWNRLEGHGFRGFRTVTVTARFESRLTIPRVPAM